MKFLLSLLAVCGALLSSCAAVHPWEEVHPWEKGAFTKSHMAFEPDRLETRFMRHVYTSKEGTQGGYGIGGAGCGCS